MHFLLCSGWRRQSLCLVNVTPHFILNLRTIKQSLSPFIKNKLIILTWIFFCNCKFTNIFKTILQICHLKAFESLRFPVDITTSMMVSQALRYMHLPFYETCFLFKLFAPTVNQEYSLDRKCKTILKVNLRRNRCVPYSL